MKITWSTCRTFARQQLRRPGIYTYILCAVVVCVMLDFSMDYRQTFHHVRRLQAALTEEQQIKQVLQNSHRDMCHPDDWNFRPLRYNDCDPNGKVNQIPLTGGFSHSMKVLLLGAIGSYEEGRCFVVDESTSDLNTPDANGIRHGFLEKYMEPIGLDEEDIMVENAKRDGRFVKRDPTEFETSMQYRRQFGKEFFLPYAGYNPIDGHLLKRSFITRLWRPLPEYRQSACHAMSDNHGLSPGDYLAFSIRHSTNIPLEQYVSEAELQPLVSKIFVVTDDCRDLTTLRQMKPEWTFVSECDVNPVRRQRNLEGGGEEVEEAWSESEERAHYIQLFTEMYAMAFSKVYIGVSTTNISWWVYFLRPFRHSFVLLDRAPGTSSQEVLDTW
mmetsp:Transcript_29765/g.45117  ORF Transcript_29765/g.45117 Transcript_29765/m.45117 type:complete len:385 (+) Transcript_29765:144-1298(+)|eukprot:CAMPEP_0178902330 /NCGR_PEP_ID=MMETSP0786-20121207/4542_1 /TAXON_ID=186022 /ORGANISM="Thalassionema frauenfeldii, Strain CCMP 1798" /LENGTH=384 /DNA_ID=CAMNT_0020573579 /DNA_START=79 /DNA_END=1233 /DNA_ORIENTATION=-